jgi:DNA-binding transcriptional MerR regulator/methylmalonyl-CoA mutase cobalamin-binding subunit
VPRTGAPAEGPWRIGEFAERVGLPAATIRAWEKRYGILDPERTQAGYRLYSPGDEDRLAAALAHIRQGLRPAQAAQRALAEATSGDRTVAVPGAIVNRLMTAVHAYDAPAVETALDEALRLGTVAGVRDVLLPALVRIGDEWERDELTVGHEHFSTHLIERRLLAASVGWERGSGPLVVLACPTAERHTLGLLCIGLCLAELGWRIAYLGADTPVAQIHRFANAVAPTLVLLCGLQSERFMDAAADISELAARHPTLLAGGGATSLIAEQLGCRTADGNPAVAAEAIAAGEEL